VDRGFLKKLDESEQSRLEELEKFSKEEKLGSISLFKSDIVAKTLEKGKQVLVTGFNADILPNTIPFSERVFVEVCPTCKCVKSPSLLTPYLERDLVVPVLDSNYADYTPSFIESILGFPHVSAMEYYDVRKLLLEQTSMSLVSRKEVTIIEEKCDQFMRNFPENSFEGRLASTILANMLPVYTSDMELLLQLIKAMEKRDTKSLSTLYDVSTVVGKFRCSQVFPFIPQVKVGQFEDLKMIPQNYRGLAFDYSDIRDTIMAGLKIAYDTSVPLETYLDIVSERKSKIKEAVRNIIGKAEPEKATFLSNLRIELEHINHEVEALKSSKKGLLIDLITNFVIQNKGSILAGLITSASLGLMGLGFVGCGAGAASGMATKVLTRKAGISIPKEAGRLAGQISTVFEPFYESMLAATLSIDKQAIQVWQIRKKLGR
jgi:hypothetical protein